MVYLHENREEFTNAVNLATHRFTPTRMSVPQRQNRSRENKWKALCGNYVGGVLGVPHGLLSGGVLLIKMFDKL